MIWDDAEELQRLAALSHPKITVDTGGLSPEATALANRLAETIAILAPEDITALLAQLEDAAGRAEALRRARRQRR